MYIFQGGDYESTQGLLGGSVHRLSHMVQANRGNRKLMCYLVLGLVLLFFLTYYLISKVSKWHRFQTWIEKITPGFKSMKCFWETLYSLSLSCRVPCSPLVFLRWDGSGFLMCNYYKGHCKMILTMRYLLTEIRWDWLVSGFIIWDCIL